jgi:hypothetical protein
VTALPDHFWAKVDKDGPIPEYRPDLGPCWVWTAALMHFGHGNFANNRGERATVLAHKLAYEDQHGPVPAGLQLDHLCRVPACVNPAHLEPVTSRENTLRGVGPSAINATKERCPQGHEYDYRYPDGRRACKTCAREASRRHLAQNRESVNARKRAWRKQRADA